MIKNQSKNKEIAGGQTLNKTLLSCLKALEAPRLSTASGCMRRAERMEQFRAGVLGGGGAEPNADSPTLLREIASIMRCMHSS